MKNEETLAMLREIKDRIEAMEFRLESSDDAEEAKPMSAPLIPPGEAERILISGTLDYCRQAAKVCDQEADKYEKIHAIPQANTEDAAAVAYRNVTDFIESCLRESRKANAAEALERDQPENALSEIWNENLKTKRSGRRNVKLSRRT